jgi:hypothetical protein
LKVLNLLSPIVIDGISGGAESGGAESGGAESCGMKT